MFKVLILTLALLLLTTNNTHGQFVKQDEAALRPIGWLYHGVWGELGIGVQAVVPAASEIDSYNSVELTFTTNFAIRTRLYDQWPMLTVRSLGMPGDSYNMNMSEIGLLASVYSSPSHSSCFLISAGIGNYSYRALMPRDSGVWTFNYERKSVLSIPYELSYISSFSPAFFGCVSLCGSINTKQPSFGLNVSFWFGTPVYHVY